MRSSHESKIAYVYGILLLIIVVLVIIFLLCDFEILPSNYCGWINNFVKNLSQKVNEFLGL